MERNRIDVKKTRSPSGAAVPRTDLTEALYRALFEEWAERGFAAVSLENVAARAGAGKAAIYRRWSSRVEFARDAIEALGLRIALNEDRGSLAADVLELQMRFRATLRHPLVRRILPDLHAEATRNPEMRAINNRVAEERRRHGGRLIDRAIERGELSATLDRELALDLLPAPLYWRMVVVGRTPTRSEVVRCAATITAALGGMGRMPDPGQS